MIDSKPIVDAVLAQLVIQITPAVTDAVVAHIRQASQAEGMAVLSLQPEALEIPMADLLDGDSHFVDKLKSMVRDEARDVISDLDVPTDDTITDQVHNGVRDYLRDYLADAVERSLDDSEFVRGRDVEDHVDLDNFDEFTDLRDRVEELEQRVKSSPYDDNEYLKPEFVTAVRDALQRIINP